MFYRFLFWNIVFWLALFLLMLILALALIYLLMYDVSVYTYYFNFSLPLINAIFYFYNNFSLTCNICIYLLMFSTPLILIYLLLILLLILCIYLSMSWHFLSKYSIYIFISCYSLICDRMICYDFCVCYSSFWYDYKLINDSLLSFYLFFCLTSTMNA